VDATARYVLVSNYSSGSVCVLPILETGGLGPIVDFVQHEGGSIHPQRQQSPHPHSVNLDRDNRLAYVPDLGLDKVMIYELDLARGKLISYHEQPWARTRSGAGPRHLAFHPNEQTVYVVNELDSTVAVFALDSARGTLKEVQSISTLPADFDEKSWAADIHVHPNGRFVYASNRGHDSIAVFSVAEETGMLSLVAYTSTQGAVPRNFGIDPTGTFLLAANQNSDDVYVFRIDQKSGRLTPTGNSVQTPTPVCVKFLPR
jgi:6-phosphogluconolactonase